MFTRENDFDAVIQDAALLNDVPVWLVKGVIGAESNFVPTAYRFEPKINDASRGLMQILEGTARSLGYARPVGDATTRTGGLFDPAVNVPLGARYLADRIRAHGGDVWAGVSAYNNGHGRRATKPTATCLWRRPDGSCGQSFTAQPGQFLNQPYVDKVQKIAAYFRGGATGPVGRTSFGGLLLAILLGVGAAWLFSKGR